MSEEPTGSENPSGQVPPSGPSGPHPRASQRRMIVGAAVAGLALSLFVAVPAVLASQPQFVRRFPQLDARYRSWSTSAHAKVACQKCHASPAMLAQAGYTAEMLGQFYFSLVSRSGRPDVFARPSNDACIRCHIDLRTVSPTGDLNIPHRAHVNVLGLECVRCHKYLVHEPSPEGKNTPRMADCLTCHDGKQAENGCQVCHTAKAAPANHASPDWDIVHADKQKELDCTKCHVWREDWCADCHSKRPRSHTDRWRSEHGDRVAQRRNCEVCHEAPFCVRCHGEVPDLDFDPALERVR